MIGNRMAMAMVWGGGILLPGRACHARCCDPPPSENFKNFHLVFD